MSRSFRSVRPAFTLIELLVVIAIIAILAAILFPVFAQAREKARQSACLSNMKQVGIGVTMYAQDYEETFPMSRYGPGTASMPWTVYVQPYVKNVGVFKCPSDPTATNPNKAARAFCPDSLVTIVNGQRRDLTPRSLASVSGLAQTGSTPAQRFPGAVMAEAFGAKLAEVERPGGTILITERYGGPNLNESLTMCEGWGATFNDVWCFTVVPHAQTGTPVNVITTRAFLEALAPSAAQREDVTGNLAGKYHAGGFNSIFADGHVKWSKLFNTYKLTNGRVEWSMWDRRAAP